MRRAGELLTIEPVGSRLVVRGELDLHTAPLLATAIDDAGADVRLDLAGVDFIDCRGLTVLIAARRQRCDDGSLELVDPSPRVLRLLELSGTTEIFVVDRRTAQH